MRGTFDVFSLSKNMFILKGLIHCSYIIVIKNAEGRVE